MTGLPGLPAELYPQIAAVSLTTRNIIALFPTEVKKNQKKTEKTFNYPGEAGTMASPGDCSSEKLVFLYAFPLDLPNQELQGIDHPRTDISPDEDQHDVLPKL